jgi:hypothetical protein
VWPFASAIAALQVSLEMQILALKRMQECDGVGARLGHATLEALNATTCALEEACTLAHKMGRAMKGGNAEQVGRAANAPNLRCALPPSCSRAFLRS